MALCLLGWVAVARGEDAAARSRLEAGLALAEAQFVEKAVYDPAQLSVRSGDGPAR